MDRMLISFPENIKIPLYNDKEIDYDVLKWYDIGNKKNYFINRTN